MRDTRTKFIVLVPLLASLSAAAEIDIPVHYDTLDNGLRMIIVPDTNVAVVSCRLYYFVGSMYEGPGTSGLSHMYEHMLFKGTKSLGTTDYRAEVPIMNRIDSLDSRIRRLRQEGVPESDQRVQELRTEIFSLLEEQRRYIKKDEIWETYLDNGGTHLNAWTGDDMTAYIVTLPKNKVELFFAIESDRMSNPVLREFYSERDVVTEERRMRYENRTIGRYWERLFALFYTAHPYRIPTIGWMSDIRAYTREKLREHVNRYYAPDNAVLVLVGNVDPRKAVADIERYFGDIPRAEEPKEEVVTREPAPIGETRFSVYDKAQPRIDILFHTPGYPDEDLYRLDVVEGVLSGRSGRLFDRLVNKEELCTDAGAGNAYRLHDGYFHAWATLKNDADPETVERILLEEITGLIERPPSPREMERVKNSIRKGFIGRLESQEGLSDQLAWFERLGTWRDMLDYPDKIAAVKPESVPAVVSRYLDPDLKTIGLLLQRAEEATGAPGGKEAY
jgi:predicted Zn-dependent peptidase